MKKPLSILITRDHLGNNELQKVIQTNQARVLRWDSFVAHSTFKGDFEPFLQDKDWIVCTSPASARLFFKGQKQQTFHGIKIACVGQKTADVVLSLNFNVDLISSVPTSLGLAQETQFAKKEGLRILYLKPDDGRYDFYEALKNQHHITCFQHYKKKFTPMPHDLKQAILKDEIDAVVFYSPSVVREYFKTFSSNEQNQIKKIKYFVIGSSTEKALNEVGVKAQAIAVGASTEDLVQRIFFPTKS